MRVGIVAHADLVSQSIAESLSRCESLNNLTFDPAPYSSSDSFDVLIVDGETGQSLDHWQPLITRIHCPVVVFGVGVSDDLQVWLRHRVLGLLDKRDSLDDLAAATAAACAGAHFLSP